MIKKIRPAIYLFACSLIVAGLLALSRGVFLQNPFQQGPAGQFELPQNLPSTIKGVDTTVNSTGVAWGENIKNELVQNLVNPWVIVKQSGQTVVGTIEKSDDAASFVRQFTLPATATNIRVFEGGDVFYTLPSSNIGSAKLFAGNKVETITVTALNSGEEFGSVYFNAATSSFYYVVEGGQQSKLYSVTVGRTPNLLYTFPGATGLGLLRLDAKKNAAYLIQPSGKCLAVDLSVKSQQDIFCELINQGVDENYVFSKLTPSLDSFSTITEVTAATGGSRAIYETNKARFLGKAARTTNALAFVEYEIIEADNSTELRPAKLQLMDLSVEKVVKNWKIDDLGQIGEVVELQPYGLNALLLIMRNNGSSKLNFLSDGDLKPIEVQGCELGCGFQLYSLQHVFYEAS